MATLFEKYNGTTDDFIRIYDVKWRAETFTASSDHTLSSVKMKVYRIGSPGTVTVGIYNTTAGAPSGTPIVSNTFDGNALTTSTAGEVKEITFASPPLLTNGSVYAIVASASTGSNSNELDWLSTSTGGGFTGGNIWASEDGGSTWPSNLTPTVFWFENYGDPNNQWNIALV